MALKSNWHLCYRYYRGAHCAFLIFGKKKWYVPCQFHSIHPRWLDPTRVSSFENLQVHWLEEIRRYADQHIKLVLIANKADLVKESQQQRENCIQAAEKYASDHDMLFYKTSALENTNVANVFQSVAADIYHALITPNDEWFPLSWPSHYIITFIIFVFNLSVVEPFKRWPNVAQTI